MKKSLIIACILTLMVGTVGTVSAGEPAHAQLAEDLLLAMQVDKMLTDTFEQMKAAQREQFMQAEGGEKMIELQDMVFAYMSQELNWDKLRPEYVQIYMEAFTEDELAGLVKFYLSPVGKTFVAKTPELTSKSMQIGQKHAMEIYPKIQEMAREFMATQMPQEPTVDADPVPMQP